MFGERQQAPVLVPAHCRRRVTADDTLQDRHAADRQRLVLRSVVDDRRRPDVALCADNNTPSPIIIAPTLRCIT